MPRTDKPYLKFTHSKALRARTLKLLDAVDAAPDPSMHRDALSQLIVDYCEEGMAYFFLEPLRTLKMGAVIERSAAVGLGGIVRLIAPTVRTLIARMDKTQLRQVSRIIRGMMG